MSIGPAARRWFASNYGKTTDRIYTSKLYLPEESWPKKSVWWIQISSQAIDPAAHDYVTIICQLSTLKNDFHYLKVPVQFINDNVEKFHRINGKINFYLSADEATMFVEIRGVGKLDFSTFLVHPK